MANEFKPKNGLIIPDGTASTVPYLDANKKLVSSSITPTNLEQLATLSADLAAKADKNNPEFTGTIFNAESATTVDIAASEDNSTVNIGRGSGDNNIYIGSGSDTVSLGGLVGIEKESFVINALGGPGSGANAGFIVIEDDVATGYMTTSGDTNYWVIKAPGSSGELSLKPGSSNDEITLNNSTQTLKNKTIETPSSDVVTLDGQASKPSNPASGYYKLYVRDSTGALTVLKSDGTEVTLTPSTPAIGDSVGSSTSGSVLFIDSSNQLAQDNSNLFWDNTNKRLGIGTNAPNGQLELASEASNKIVSLRTAANGGEGHQIDFATSQGTLASPTSSGSTQILGDISARGYASGALRTGGLLRFTQSGSYASNTVPTAMELYLGDGTNPIALAMRVAPTGRTGFGTSTISARVHAYETAYNVPAIIAEASSASYVQEIVFLNAHKAANSNFAFQRMYSGNGGDAEFSFRGDGNGYCDGAWTGGGADYAEYFEWADGNPDNQDRRGYSVSLVNNKIKIAEEGETVIGVVSARPGVLGDGDIGRWTKKYLKDDFGSYLLDENGNRQLNPEFNPEEEYISREDRKEWSAIGLVGKLRIRKGQIVSPSWIKMRDISDSVEEFLVR